MHSRRRPRTDVASVQAEALVHGQGEGLLRDRGESISSFLKIQDCEGSQPTTGSSGLRRDVTHRFDARQHADVSGEVGGLENGLVLPPEVQVHHQRLELLSDDPGFVLYVPAVRRTDQILTNTPKTVDPGGGQDRLTPEITQNPCSWRDTGCL